MTNKTICRVEKTKNFTTINNTALKDTNLSLRAKGLFTYMMSLPDDWTFYIDELSKHSTDSKEITRKAFNELGHNGYISAKVKFDDKTKKILAEALTGKSYTKPVWRPWE